MFQDIHIQQHEIEEYIKGAILSHLTEGVRQEIAEVAKKMLTTKNIVKIAENLIDKSVEAASKEGIPWQIKNEIERDLKDYISEGATAFANSKAVKDKCHKHGKALAADIINLDKFEVNISVYVKLKEG